LESIIWKTTAKLKVEIYPDIAKWPSGKYRALLPTFLSNIVKLKKRGKDLCHRAKYKMVLISSLNW
jgi:hypothetical protein